MFEQVVATREPNLSAFAAGDCAKDFCLFFVLGISMPFEVLLGAKGFVALIAAEWAIVAIDMFSA
jgi:hypothetical protein